MAPPAPSTSLSHFARGLRAYLLEGRVPRDWAVAKAVRGERGDKNNIGLESTEQENHMARQSTLRSLVRCGALLGATLIGFSATAQQAAPLPRIGVVLPKAQLGQGNTGQDVSEPVRQLIIAYMSGPVLELVPLQARIPAQIEAEARAQNCTHVLYANVEQKKKGGGMGGLLSKMGPAASMLPGVGALGGASDAIIAGVASQAISQAAAQAAQQEAMSALTQSQAGTVKARDEVTLDYRFVNVAGANPVLEDKLSRKAESDGQDLLSPLIEELATIAITAAVEHQKNAVSAPGAQQ